MSHAGASCVVFLLQWNGEGALGARTRSGMFVIEAKEHLPCFAVLPFMKKAGPLWPAFSGMLDGRLLLLVDFFEVDVGDLFVGCS